jgi:hypothetical protein
MSDMKTLLEKNTETLNRIARDTTKLRRAYPDSNIPESIFQERHSADSVYGDNTSVIGDQEFAFDDFLVNSKAYRHALLLAQSVTSERSKSDLNVSGSLGGDYLASNEHLRDAIASVSLEESDMHEMNATPEEESPNRSSQLSKSTRDKKVLWTAPDSYRITDPRPFVARVDWFDVFNLDRNELVGKSKKAIESQNIFWELTEREHKWLQDLSTCLKLYRDGLFLRWPPAVKDPFTFLQKGFETIERLEKVQKEVLYLPLLEHWEHQGAWADFIAAPFLNFIDEAAEIYKTVATSYPYQTSRFKEEIENNSSFQAFAHDMSQHPWSHKLDYSHFLKTPITSLQGRCLLLEVLKRTSDVGSSRESEISSVVSIQVSYVSNGQFSGAELERTGFQEISGEV